MRLCTCVVACWLLAPAAFAQSLFVSDGERAAEAAAAWTVGPSSTGWEGVAAVTLNGRVDLGVGVGRYTFASPGSDSYVERALLARYYLFKEEPDQAAASLALQGQYFRSDAGWYGLAGVTVSRRVPLGPALTLHPFLGFNYGGESNTIGDGPPAREVYLTRQFGVHALMPLGARSWLRVTLDEHAFRRETYRAVRLGFGTRF
jgi:hypothetical protein